MKKLLVLLMAFSGCATMVDKSEFEVTDQVKFEADFKTCDEMAKDLKARFGWSQVPLVECMYRNGHRLKRKAE